MRRGRSKGVLLALLLTLLCGLSGCGSDSEQTGDRTLTVLAAASLTSTFAEMGKAFERDHDGATVEFSFAGSSDLVAQLQQGAPADVFASADTATMDKVTAADLQAEMPKPFAANTLEIATPPGNPGKVTRFADLARSGLKVVVCAPVVPCGAATQRMQAATGVTIKPVSEEQSVTDVMGKVSSGEADAGVVYVTDVAAAGSKVHGVPIEEAGLVVNTYPIVTLKDSKNAKLAREFVEFVLGDKGQEILRDAGFAKP